jgi:SAM-dependent methyltransferase
MTWDEHAEWWQRNFTDGADPEYEEQILPLLDEHLDGARRVLDIGCGEGQVARRAVARGAFVVGVDPTSGQLLTAHARGGGVLYARSTAEALPARDAEFDAAVICLTLEHLDPFEPAIHEVARVLAPGGRFLCFLNHPLLQAPGSGWIDDHILEEQYWRVGPYLPDDVAMEEVAPGVRLPFMHRPLSRYINVMSACGLLVDHMAEPPPPPGFLAQAPEYAAAATIPRLLFLRARKHAT